MKKIIALFALINLVACDRTIVLIDENNFSYTGLVEVPSFVTAASQDIEICWDNLTTDIQCHETDPLEDIDSISMIRFPDLTQDEVEDKLSNDALQQADQDGYVENIELDGTCASLSSLSFMGTAIDVPSEYIEGSTYLMLFSTGTTVGVGSRNLVFLEPSSASDVQEVSVGEGCGILDFTVDLNSLSTVEVRSDGPWEIDWSQVTVNGLGNQLQFSNVDSLMVGFYQGMSVTDLENRFLDLELMATELYTLPLSGGVTADLSQMEGFSGFAGDGTWILALRCSLCQNPAPLFLTILEPV